MKYVKALNGLRGFACVNVVIFHYVWWIFRPLGQHGVNMFFCLSSYLLTSQLYQQYYEIQKLNLVNYFIRRFFRIYPCMTIAILSDYLSGRLPFQECFDSFILWGFYDLYWTIYVEFRSYFMLPIIVFIFGIIKNKTIKYILVILGLACLVFQNIMFPLTEYWGHEKSSLDTNYIFLHYSPNFIIPSLIAILHYHYKTSSFNLYDFLNKIFRQELIIFTKNAIVISITFAHFGFSLYWLYLLVFQGYKGEFIFLFDMKVMFAFFYSFLIILINDNDTVISRLFSSKFFVFLGDISFPIYLFHMLIKFMIANISGHTGKNDVLPPLLSIPFIFLICHVVHKYYEIKIINYTKNLCLEKKSDTYDQIVEAHNMKTSENTKSFKVQNDMEKFGTLFQ